MPADPQQLVTVTDEFGRPVEIPQDTAENLGLFAPSGLNIEEQIPQPEMLAENTLLMPEAQPEDVQGFLPQAPTEADLVAQIAAEQQPALDPNADLLAHTDSREPVVPPQFDLNTAPPPDNPNRIPAGGRTVGHLDPAQAPQPDIQGRIQQATAEEILRRLEHPGGGGLGRNGRAQVTALGEQAAGLGDRLGELGTEGRDLLNQYEKSLLDQGNIRQQREQEVVDLLGTFDAEQHAAEKEFELDRADIQHEAELAGEHLSESIRQFSEMRIDPYRMFSNADQGTRISASLGVAIGAGLQTMQSIMFPGSNPTNTALHILDRAVDRDIAAQRANVSIAGRGVQQQRGFLAHLQQRFGNALASQGAYRAVAYRRLAGQLRGVAASAASTLDVQAAEQAVNMLEMRANAAEQQAVSQQQAGVIQQRTDILHRARRGHRRESLSSLTSLYRAMTPEQVASIPVGTTLGQFRVTNPAAFARMSTVMSPEQQGRMFAGASEAANLRSIMQELIALRRTHDGGTISPADRARANALITRAVSAFGSVNDLGTMQAGDVERMQSAMPDPTEFYSPTTDVEASLQGIIETVDSGVRESSRGWGIAPRWDNAAQDEDQFGARPGFTATGR